ncbi:MAG TPA: MaoC/PaaZ C-terminal domain-containing protein [Solirubrobacterales bacterium]|nr:MaoC/PaaZ C-terminal domain-containing protein [Solirubrobacterales bacterium]
MSDILASDFDALEVGGRFQTRGRTITESDLVSFAALTGDFHPIHTDVEWAAESEFNGRIAHGMLLLSYCVGLVPLDPAQVLALRGFERIAFKRPVRIGDTIHVEGELESKKELDDATGLVVFSWKIVNQRGETAAVAKVKVVWRRELQPAPEPAVAAPAREQVYL